MFELPDGVPIKQVLLNIARGFNVLINSEDSVNLHRLIMALGSQDPKLSLIFFEAGPERVLKGMERLLSKVHQLGTLHIEKPHNAAEHFFCLVKGGANFRLLFGCGDVLIGDAAEAHLLEVVELFMRAYRPEPA